MGKKKGKKKGCRMASLALVALALACAGQQAIAQEEGGDLVSTRGFIWDSYFPPSGNLFEITILGNPFTDATVEMTIPDAMNPYCEVSYVVFVPSNWGPNARQWQSFVLTPVAWSSTGRPVMAVSPHVTLWPLDPTQPPKLPGGGRFPPDPSLPEIDVPLPPLEPALPG
jgi:hypothetical protein